MKEWGEIARAIDEADIDFLGSQIQGKKRSADSEIDFENRADNYSRLLEIKEMFWETEAEKISELLLSVDDGGFYEMTSLKDKLTAVNDGRKFFENYSKSSGLKNKFFLYIKEIILEKPSDVLPIHNKFIQTQMYSKERWLLMQKILGDLPPEVYKLQKFWFDTVTQKTYRQYQKDTSEKFGISFIFLILVCIATLYKLVF